MTMGRVMDEKHADRRARPRSAGGWWARGWAFVRRRVSRTTRRQRLVSAGVVLLAAVLIAVSARASGGTDLRPSRNSDIIDLVRSQSDRNRRLAAQVEQLQKQVQQLSSAEAVAPDPALSAAERAGSAVAVHGPGVEVTLDDAPLSVQPEGVDPDLLVVHQQDIQTFTNALWRAGAEAMTIQGQRVGPNTSVKCVGNTVIVQGVPYAPPYVIRAIGDQDAMLATLASDPAAIIYRQYVTAYRLGYSQKPVSDIRMPAWPVAPELTHATPVPAR